MERNQINSQETKLKSYLENYYSNSSPRKIAKISFDTNKAKSIDLINSFELIKNTSIKSNGNIKNNIEFPNESIILNKESKNIEKKIFNFEKNIENFVLNNISHENLEKVINPYFIIKENKLNRTNIITGNSDEYNSLSGINIALDNLTSRNPGIPCKIFC